MQNTLFHDLASSHFDFLISDYGYEIYEGPEIVQETRSFGRIAFISPPRKKKLKQTIVEITWDRGHVLMEIGNPDLQKNDWIDLADVVRLSKLDLEVYPKPDFSKDDKEIIETGLRNIYELTRKYCRPILLGNFSIPKRIIEARIAKRKQDLEKMRQDWMKKNKGKT